MLTDNYRQHDLVTPVKRLSYTDKYDKVIKIANKVILPDFEPLPLIEKRPYDEYT